MKCEVMKLIGRNLMYARCQELKTQGFSISKKISFEEFDRHEFEAWTDECRNLLSLCQPEQYFPMNLKPSQIEWLLMVLSDTRHKIFREKSNTKGCCSSSFSVHKRLVFNHTIPRLST